MIVGVNQEGGVIMQTVLIDPDELEKAEKEKQEKELMEFMKKARRKWNE